ncbi:MAG: glycosyltransferase [Pseudomonadota bacterium]
MRHFKARLDAGRFDRLAGLIGTDDPFDGGDALFWAVDHLLVHQRTDLLPDLATLARSTSPFAARIWRAVCLWYDGAQDQALASLERTFRDGSHSGFARRGARAWAMYLSLPRFETVLSEPELRVQDAPIFQFWDTVPPPPDVAREMAAWSGLASKKYACFSAEKAIRFFAENIGDTEAKLLRACPHPAIQSDFFRLGKLMVDGGIYVDADARMRALFSGVYRNLGDRTLLWFRTRAAEMTIVNGFIVSPPGGAFVQAAFKVACRRLAAGEKLHVFDYAGPTLVTQAALRLFERNRLGDVATLSDGYVARHILGQVDAAYKRDARNWRRWMTSSDATHDGAGP